MAENLFLIYYRDDPDRVGLQVGEAIYELDSTISSLDWLLRNVPIHELEGYLLGARGAVFSPAEETLRPVIGSQEVWAAGVTYKRSEEARERESHNSTVYTRVYNAERPELFFKALGSEVVGSGQPVGIRYDATWSVPEPELVIVFNPRMEVVGFTIGNDMSSRDIEGDNPLYLPQAKVYERSCAVGTRLWLQPGRTTWPEATISIAIRRKDQVVFEGETSTASIHRSLADLKEYLGRCKRFTHGVLLFTGTGIVPPDSFTLKEGDEVRIRIDPLGELVNNVTVIQRQTEI
jgi:2-dehydro-3-deoxy-D-arabinonate dehydratase